MSLRTEAAVLLAALLPAAAATAQPATSATQPTAATAQPASATGESDAAAPAGPAAAVETIDLREYRGELVELDEGGARLLADGETLAVPLAELREVRLAEPPDALARHGQDVVVTAGGDRLAVDEVEVGGDAVSVRGPLVGRVELPLRAVRTLLLPGADTTPRELLDRLAERDASAAGRDVICIDRDGEWTAVPGALRAMDAETVRFGWQGREQSVPRRSVPAIRLAGPAREAVGAAAVLGTDGSSLQAEGAAFDGDSWRIRAAELGELDCAAGAVAAVRFRSPRAAWLSELEPVRVERYGLFGGGLGWRADEALAGGPLSLGGRRYDRGLAVHSFCELTFALDGRFEQLVARVGIDDAVRPAGAADVTFLADGEPLAETVTVTGGDEPLPVRLSVSGARELTIRVGFGPDGLDAADHVDLAGARLIRPAP